MRVATSTSLASPKKGLSGELGNQLIEAALDGIAVDQYGTTGMFLVTCTTSLENALGAEIAYLHGSQVGSQNKFIRIDQGLHTSNISQTFTLDPDLKETQYIIQMDHRLGTLLTPTGKTPTPVSFIDDDNIATYYVSSDDYVKSPNPDDLKSDGSDGTDIGKDGYFAIDGPIGTVLKINIGASIGLNTSDYLFNTLGGGQTMSLAYVGGVMTPVKFIDTVIKVTGASTGYTLHVPVRYIK